MEKGHYVYLVRCADDTVYCGYARDLCGRIQAHNSGKGAKYTRSRRPVTLIYYESFQEKGAALSREAALKKLSHRQKLALAEGFPLQKG